MSGRGKVWLAWCIVMAFLATGGSITMSDHFGVPNPIVALIATWVLGSAVYFFARGVETHDKEKTRAIEKDRARLVGSKRRCFPEDPFAPQ